MSRKIINNSIDAFLNGVPFSNSNTQVIVHDNNCIELVLHGNCIASKQNGVLTISTCGWNTNVTKARLNALPNVSIKNIKGKLHLNGKEWDGLPITL